MQRTLTYLYSRRSRSDLITFILAAGGFPAAPLRFMRCDCETFMSVARENASAPSSQWLYIMQQVSSNCP
jgi:hypothetical protein